MAGAEPLPEWEREFLEEQLVHAAAEAIESSVTFRQHFTAAHPLGSLHPAAAEFARLALSPPPPPGSTTMDRKLTAADLVSYFVEISTAEGTQTRIVRAAYETTESGWVVFKDHEHRTVARFADRTILGVTRGEQPDPVPQPDEDRIRGAMAEAQAHPGRTVTR